MDVTEYFDQKKVRYEVRHHWPTYTSQKMAAAEHVPGMKVAKPVIVQAAGHYYMCVLPACCRVDLDALACELQVDEVRMATEREMLGLFPGCELGAEPPVGNIFGLPTLMDKSLAQDDFLVFQSGRHSEAIKVDRADYERVAEPRTLEFSYHLH